MTVVDRVLGTIMIRFLLLMVSIFPTIAFAQQYKIDWYSIAGGGGTSVKGIYSLSGTIAQPTAADWIGAKGQFVLTGFWAIQTPGAPTLSVTPASRGQITISWVPNMPGWILQETRSLASPSWTNSESGATNPMTLPTIGSQMFYRIYKKN